MESIFEYYTGSCFGLLHFSSSLSIITLQRVLLHLLPQHLSNRCSSDTKVATSRQDHDSMSWHVRRSLQIRLGLPESTFADSIIASLFVLALIGASSEPMTAPNLVPFLILWMFCPVDNQVRHLLNWFANFLTACGVTSEAEYPTAWRLSISHWKQMRGMTVRSRST